MNASYLAAEGTLGVWQAQAAGSPQHLEEVGQGRVGPCLPLGDLPWACWLGATVVGTSEGTSGVTGGLEASVAGPWQEEEGIGKNAGVWS